MRRHHAQGCHFTGGCARCFQILLSSWGLRLLALVNDCVVGGRQPDCRIVAAIKKHVPARVSAEQQEAPFRESWAECCAVEKLHFRSAVAHAHDAVRGSAVPYGVTLLGGKPRSPFDAEPLREFRVAAVADGCPERAALGQMRLGRRRVRDLDLGPVHGGADHRGVVTFAQPVRCRGQQFRVLKHRGRIEGVPRARRRNPSASRGGPTGPGRWRR
jgi:hypothetical protein